MSCHYSYEQLLKAISTNDKDQLKEAEFYLGRKAQYTPLLNGGDALCAAIEYEHQDLVNEYMSRNIEQLQSLNAYRRSRKACQLAKVACRKENFEVFEKLLTICPISNWINSDLVHAAAEQGFFQLMNLILREIQKDPDISDNLVYNLDSMIPQFLSLSFTNGNRFHDKFSEEIQNHHIYILNWRKIEEIHRSVVLSDMEELNRLIQEIDNWYEIRYSAFGFLNPMTVFGLSALLGEEELLVYLYHQTTQCSDFVRLRLAEEACDFACQRGRVHIVQRLLDEQWIDDLWNKLWDNRCKAAFNKKRIEMSHFLLDRFFSVQGERSPTASSVRMRELVSTGDGGLVQKAIRAMKGGFASDWEANNELWEGYKHALEEGYPEILQQFVTALDLLNPIPSHTAKVHFAPNDEVFKGTLKKISNMSEVNVEILLSCYFKVNQTLPSFAPEEGSGLAVVLAYVIRECPQNLTICSNDLLLSRVKINSVQLLDYCDFNGIDIGFLHRSDKNVDIYRLCNLFRICSGTSIHWDGLLHSVLHLQDEAFKLFCRYAQHYRIEINNDRLHLEREKCQICRMDENRELANKYQRLLDVFRYGVSTPLFSLKHQCRLSIRRAIYRTESQMSKSDRILTLHKHHQYPKELVRYLLYTEDEYPRHYRDYMLLNMNDVEEDYLISDDEDDEYFGDVINEYDDYDALDFEDECDFEDFFDEDGLDENEFDGCVIRLG